jgi:hypothetical protein
MSRRPATDEKKRFGAGGIVLVVLGGFLLLLLPFLPLILAVIEEVCFGTRHVEELCETIGIHDFLGKLYGPVIRVIMNFF